jgi:secondary thiamine-phosphate synthase enzyme
MESIQIRTQSHQELREITAQVRDFVAASGAKSGVVVVFVPHTTAGVTLNENYDTNVERDMLADLDRLLPRRQEYYRHAEGNSAAHLKTTLVGSSVRVPVLNGELQLGTWQGVFLCEFDGPRARQVHMLMMEG